MKKTPQQFAAQFTDGEAECANIVIRYLLNAGVDGSHFNTRRTGTYVDFFYPPAIRIKFRGVKRYLLSWMSLEEYAAHDLPYHAEPGSKAEDHRIRIYFGEQSDLNAILPIMKPEIDRLIEFLREYYIDRCVIHQFPVKEGS